MLIRPPPVVPFFFVATTMYEISSNPWLSLAGNQDIQQCKIAIVLLEMG